ncbi:dienelactone hydrolase family protein [Herbaspirillum sp.]|uniref:dienelactone hydrolase family protein n=1 Tax=Herbaspirillum TaxID=963 RepID=UPI002582A0CE|nr:dienelactone hydrolase family protein [Herbaspirillum sp.]MCP3654203.1 dienelactone hydrolase family protein [Herbaspirillum sp.]MCP3949276.1 dienelactone hydrolase family protein [Herbaspirillum sp.]MCP4030283.1 dienelactone hydrolase family protein [Herbaspirillum sp.]MCP4556982.1 dienelactone hydrolase family protein [Herbaspirillum sp.]
MRHWGKPLAAFCIAASLAVIGSWAQAAPNSAPPPPLEARRVSLTSVDNKGGKATALYGVWIKARKSLTTKGPAPTVIALHGCGGLYSMVKDGKGEFTPRHLAMARVLSDAGYNVLFPDSFTPRGRRSTCQDTVAQREVSAMNRRYDVQAALHWVTSQPDVDVKRIALLGWSHGASTLLASINLAETDVAVRKIQPRAAVAFYPDCRPYAKTTEPFKPAAPLLILMGENDDWTPPQACEAIEEKMKGSDTEIALRLYPDTYHDFDAPGLPVHVRMDVAGVGKRGEGVTSGGNPDARSQAYRSMLNFLDAKLNY